MKLNIVYNKKTMLWHVKFGRLTLFTTDCYDIAEDFKLQYLEDHDADRKYLLKISERR